MPLWDLGAACPRPRQNHYTKAFMSWVLLLSAQCSSAFLQFSIITCGKAGGGGGGTWGGGRKSTHQLPSLKIKGEAKEILRSPQFQRHRHKHRGDFCVWETVFGEEGRWGLSFCEERCCQVMHVRICSEPLKLIDSEVDGTKSIWVESVWYKCQVAYVFFCTNSK